MMAGSAGVGASRGTPRQHNNFHCLPSDMIARRQPLPDCLPRRTWVPGLHGLATMAFLALFLPACATTSKPLQYSPMPALARQESLERPENTLKNLSYEELLARGNHHLANGSAQLAQLHFRMSLEKNSGSAAAYAGLGQSLAMNGDNAAALAALDRALTLDENNRQALLASSKLHRAEKNFAQAEAQLIQARKSNPSDPEILSELGINYGLMGQEENAEAILRQVADLRPTDPAAHNNLGFNYLLRKKFPEAVEALQRAVALAPDDRRIRNNLAAAYALNNKSQKAFDLLRQTEGEAAAYNNLGYFYMIRGLNDPARESFEKALESSPRYYGRAKANLDRLENEF